MIKKHYLKLPLYTDERLKSVTNIALAIATYIIVDDIVSIDSISEISEALAYISENLGGDLSVKTLCSALHTSKNVLWATYDGKKWTPSVYDMDGTFGLHWSGTYYYGEKDFISQFNRTEKAVRDKWEKGETVQSGA